MVCASPFSEILLELPSSEEVIVLSKKAIQVLDENAFVDFPNLTVSLKNFCFIVAIT